MTEQSLSFDISGVDDFDQKVINDSHEKPVLVDFWADWCAPCKALMPILEQVTDDYAGELRLARVNCDQQQEIVMRFGIRSLPTVVLFKDGQPVDGFMGAQPESTVRAMLKPHVAEPQAAPEDPLAAARALYEQNRPGEAEALLQDLLEQDNQNACALILYARCLAERGEFTDAQALLDAVKGDDHKAELNAARAQLTFLQQVKELPAAAELEARLASKPDDAEAAYQLSIRQLSQQQYEAALDRLLQLFMRHRDYGGGLPHQTLLQVFDLLGNDHPLVGTYRRKLYQALY